MTRRKLFDQTFFLSIRFSSRVVRARELYPRLHADDADQQRRSMQPPPQRPTVANSEEAEKTPGDPGRPASVLVFSWLTSPRAGGAEWSGAAGPRRAAPFSRGGPPLLTDVQSLEWAFKKCALNHETREHCQVLLDPGHNALILKTRSTRQQSWPSYAAK
jgi:hypothetical protein